MMDERNPSSSLKKVCCYCNNACSGAHQCRKCSKPCHAIAPCSFSADDDEGFGAKVTCCNCWLSDDDDDVVMDQNANVVRSNEATNNDQDDDAFEQFANSQITAEDNDNIDASASSSTRKRRGYTIEEKVRILDCAKTSSIHAASRRFSLDRNTIRGWKKQEAALRKMHQLAKRKRLIGGGRKLTNAQFDQELSDWVRGLRDKKLREIDGRHDEKIHVFKKEGAIPNGLALLKQRRKEDAVIKGVEEIDLGEDESDASVDI
ncbi:hypothetical protein niasHT_032480 [Heterodera trifolii]|uniref:SCAN domain-containing protein n=1 Tax=Heterodera trifolii TaxID=157864 RepID=A0ABD2IV51_9BILA